MARVIALLILVSGCGGGVWSYDRVDGFCPEGTNLMEGGACVRWDQEICCSCLIDTPKKTGGGSCLATVEYDACASYDMEETLKPMVEGCLGCRKSCWKALGLVPLTPRTGGG